MIWPKFLAQSAGTGNLQTLLRKERKPCTKVGYNTQKQSNTACILPQKEPLVDLIAPIRSVLSPSKALHIVVALGTKK